MLADGAVVRVVEQQRVRVVPPHLEQPQRLARALERLHAEERAPGGRRRVEVVVRHFAPLGDLLHADVVGGHALALALGLPPPRVPDESKKNKKSESGAIVSD